MPNRNWWGAVMRYPLLAALMLSGWSLAWAAYPPTAPAATSAPAAPTDAQRRSAAVALNYSRAALHRIRRNPSVRVMVEE